MLTLEEKQQFVELSRANPENFFRKILKCETLWRGELEILDAIAAHDKVVVSSGHALGKDFIGGRLPLWFLSTYYPATVVMTAPSERQVESIMWAELSRAYEDAGGRRRFGGEAIKSLKLEIEQDRHFCIAFTTKETKGQIGKFQGFHNENVLIIVSEAQAIDDTIFDQIEGISTSGNTKIILLGNPLRNTGFFAKAIKNRMWGYHHIRLNCEDNPNFIEQREVIPGLASYRWVIDMRNKYGVESPMYQARVQGLIPDVSIDTIIPYHLVEMSVDRPINIPFGARRIVSNDPATFGDDENVIQVLEEGRLLYQHITGKQRTTVTANQIAIIKKKFNADAIAVDTVGEGRGVADVLMDDLGEDVIEVKGSYAAPHENDYLNMRAEAQFYALQMFQDGFTSIPNDQMLMEELAETKFFTNRRGLIQCEDKEDIKDRLGRSPNRADCYIQGLWAMRSVVKKPTSRISKWAEDAKKQTEKRSAMAA